MSDFGWTNNTRRNPSSSSDKSSIERIAAAESPESPIEAVLNGVRRLVSYPSRLRNAVRASGDVKPARSLVVKSRSVLWTGMSFPSPGSLISILPVRCTANDRCILPQTQCEVLLEALSLLIVVVIPVEPGRLPDHQEKGCQVLLGGLIVLLDYSLW